METNENEYDETFIKEEIDFDVLCKVKKEIDITSDDNIEHSGIDEIKCYTMQTFFKPIKLEKIINENVQSVHEDAHSTEKPSEQNNSTDGFQSDSRILEYALRGPKTHDGFETDKHFLVNQEFTGSDENIPAIDLNFEEVRLNLSDPVSNRDLSLKKDKRIRLPDFCLFCKKQVNNFCRHVFRNHSAECEVQKIMSKPKNSKERKFLLKYLRKKGNFVLNSQCCVKPMKRSKHWLPDDYYPCSKCLGFYARKQLWKHRKGCQENENFIIPANAQNALVRNLKIDPKLKQLVFPRMRADRISLTVKKDSLICAFGSQMRIDQEKHSINVVSRKMRELGKLLVEIRKSDQSIIGLFDALRPQHYDKIVKATQNVAKYDDKKLSYSSPTLALNIAKSITQCCNLAVMQMLKNAGVEAAEIKSDLNTLIELIEANWKFDVSFQAADDLNSRKRNKITIVSLASDLKLFKDYLNNTANAIKLPQTDFDAEAYLNLLETIYCRVLLLNRHRSEELQRLSLSAYLSANSQDNCEEFSTVITEKILNKYLKRVMIFGNHTRVVPVLFTADVQKDITVLIKARDKFVGKNNPFLFAKPNSRTTICGCKVIEKHAKLCGAKNPKAITSMRLRKHITTLTQILNMSDYDIEQLANFMGHTIKIEYRLPDDIYQTAKISKLLMLMEDGEADTYKGKGLDDIDLNLEEEIVEESESKDTAGKIEEETEPYPSISNTLQESSLSVATVTSTQTSVTNKKKRILVPWTDNQKSVVLKYFKDHIDLSKPPKRNECEALKEKYPELLSNKDWLKIKVFIQNTYTRKYVNVYNIS